MSCIEVINSKNLTDVDELEQKLKQETFDVNLPNGAQVTQHDEKAYTNLYKNGKSFDDVSEKKLDDPSIEKGIHFAFDFKLHPEGVKKMTTIGNTIQSNTLILQHECVMFTYAYAITAVAENPNDGLLCQFVLFPISFTYRHPTNSTKGGIPPKMKQKAPELLDVTLKVGSVADLMELSAEMDGTYKCKTLITLESLKNITSNGVATLRIEMTIDDAYFKLDEYVELSPKMAPISKNSDQILTSILKGEKVPKSDWVVTVADGSPRDFHVHGPILADSSHILRAAITSHMSIGNDVLTMVSHENRFILQKLTSEDMKVFLKFIYQRRFELPKFDSVSRVGMVLTHFFRDDILEFFENWQAILINKMMQLDRTKGVETISECVKALITVTSAPNGALLAAYNVALIVASDALNIYENGDSKGSKIEKRVKKMLGYDWKLIDDILELIKDYKEAVCGVEKYTIV